MKIFEKYKKLSLPLKATLWSTVCVFSQKAFSMITVPVFTRLMSTEEYGEFSVYSSVYGILVVIATLNINGILATRGFSKYKERSAEFISNMQIISSVSVFLFFIIFLFVRKWVYDISGLNAIELLCMFGVMFVTPAFEIWSAKKRYEYRYKSILAITFLFLGSNAFFGISAVYFSDNKGEARIVSYCLIQIVLYGILYFINYKEFLFDREMMWYIIKFNLPLIPQGLANQVLSRSDVFMIQYILSRSEAGIYSLGYSAAMIIVILTTSINNTYIPWLYQRLEQKELSKIKSVSKYMICLIFFGVSSIILVAPEIIILFAPREYSDATYVIPPAVAGIGFTMVYSLFVGVEMYCEKTIVIMFGSVGVALVNITLNAFFVPKFGAVAAAYTTLISYIGYAIVHFFLARRFCASRFNIMEIYDLKFLVKASLTLVLFMMFSVNLYQATLIRYILLFVIVMIFSGICIRKKNMVEFI